MYTGRSSVMGSKFYTMPIFLLLKFGFLDHREVLCYVLSSHGSWVPVRTWDAFLLCLLCRVDSYVVPTSNENKLMREAMEGERLR